MFNSPEIFPGQISYFKVEEVFLISGGGPQFSMHVEEPASSDLGQGKLQERQEAREVKCLRS